ncbi:hypothetical protein JTB14_016864 [Gonioctena quinquepunctata]|nr:hypothetical protein JTB14_016864 [Gonioctena quinquepunctata]
MFFFSSPPDTNREFNHLSTNLYKASDYDRLALSLLSPLPNEQDFAINVCTLLSNDGKHTLKLEKHPRLVDYLLSHAGIFSHGSLRQLFVHLYSNIRKKPIHNFWRDVLESQEFLDLTDENKFKPKPEGVEEPPQKCETILAGDEINTALLALQTQTNAAEERAKVPEETTCDMDCVESGSDCEIVGDDCDSSKFATPGDCNLFCLRRSLGTQDYVGQRVLQIATILRNLSFIEENVPVLVKSVPFVRFLLLCSTSRWNVLRNLGMDMLSNIAADFIVKDFHADILASSLLKIITNGLRSEDRAACLSSLDVLNKLSQNEQNEDVMLRSLQSQVYKSVCSFLTIHDVMLLIYTLECLYSLSSLGERSCTFIVNNHGVIDTLVSLVTVEGKSYGPKACIGMKLVETVPSSAQTQSQTQTTQQSTTATTSATSSTTSSAAVGSSLGSSPTSSTTASTSTPIVCSSPTPKAVAMPSTPVRAVQIAPQRLIPITPTSTTSITLTTVAQSNAVMTPQQLIQQQHAHQQAIHENEQFALAWLRATYEPCANGKVDHQELYRHYMNSCSKIGRRGVISPLHFPRCVRSIFGGTVGPNPMKPANPTDPQYYDGIKVRDKPLIISIPASSSFPQPSVVTTTSTATSTPAKGHQQVRRKSVQPVLVTPAKLPQALAAPLTVVAAAGDINEMNGGSSASSSTPMSPASPILKAQLSAPPKQSREAGGGAVSPNTCKGDTKSQAMAHPHLSQALLGSTATTSTTTVAMSAAGQSAKDSGGGGSQAGQTSSTSLIKSLLATKVAARQQRLLAQQSSAAYPEFQSKKDALKVSPRINGVRQLFADNDIGDPSVSSTTQFTGLTKGKKEPPQPPPPPLAPLSNNVKGGKTHRMDNEDSDSIGNNSLASSSGVGTVGIGGVSSTEDGDNSLTSFEGLLNGMPNLENPLNEDSNSKDYAKIVGSEITMDKPLRLADLLEKKFEKSPPMLNGSLGKELRLGEKTMDLVENHIEKALSRDAGCNIESARLPVCMEMKQEIKLEDIEVKEEPSEKPTLKRSASEELMEIEPKKPLLSANVNGSVTAGSPAPDSVSSSNGEEGPSTVSTAAAKLFADIAADILEDEDEEQLLQEARGGATAHMMETQAQVQMPVQQSPLQQIIVDNNQQMLLTQQRQIIVSQARCRRRIRWSYLQAPN